MTSQSWEILSTFLQTTFRTSSRTQTGDTTPSLRNTPALHCMNRYARIRTHSTALLSTSALGQDFLREATKTSDAWPELWHFKFRRQDIQRGIIKHRSVVFLSDEG